MKKKITALLLALTLLLSATALTGCGGDSGESSDGPVSLTLSLWDEAQLPVIQENVDAFNAAHEGEIKVNIEQIPWDTYWTKLDASLETNEAPDVFWMNTYVQKYVDAGVLEPLDSYIEGESFDMSVYAEGRVNAYNVNGQQYALPKGLDAVAVALNTELFDRYGVELPQEGWTWDDMRDIATQLRDAIAAAGGSEYPIVMELDAQPSWMNFLYQNGGNYLSDDGKTCGIALPESKDAIQQVVDLMNDEQMAPYSVLTETKGTDLFISGQAAIVFIGSWRAGGQLSGGRRQCPADPDALHGCGQQDQHGRSGLCYVCQLREQGSRLGVDEVHHRRRGHEPRGGRGHRHPGVPVRTGGVCGQL